MNYGKIYDEPFEKYLTTDCVGSHRLDDVLPRPRVYYSKYLLKSIPPAADSPAFAFGRYFHCLALEGESEVDKRFAVLPEGIDRRTKQGKEDYAAFVASSSGKQVIKNSDVELAWAMLTGVRTKPSAVKLLARGHPEVTFRYKLPFFGVQARVDWFDGNAEAGPACINLKTVDTLEDFDKQYCNYHYYRGDAFYRMVVAKVWDIHPTAPQMINLVVEKSPPHECAILIPDAESLEIGAREVIERLSVLARCYESGVWPGEADEPRKISLPQWKIKQYEATQ